MKRPTGEWQEEEQPMMEGVRAAGWREIFREAQSQIRTGEQRCKMLSRGVESTENSPSVQKAGGSAVKHKDISRILQVLRSQACWRKSWSRPQKGWRQRWPEFNCSCNKALTQLSYRLHWQSPPVQQPDRKTGGHDTSGGKYYLVQSLQFFLKQTTQHTIKNYKKHKEARK